MKTAVADSSIMRFLTGLLVLFVPCLVQAQVHDYIKVDPEPISIGPVPCSFGTVTGSAQLTNTDSDEIIFTGLSLSGRDSARFSVSIAIPFRIGPGASRNITVRFFPTCSNGAGEREAKLTLTSARGSLSIPLQGILVNSGDIVVDQITVPDIPVNVGDTFDLPVIVTGFTPSPDVGAWTAQMSFNASVMTPADPDERGSITSGLHTIDLSRSGVTVNPRDTIATVRMIALLGDARSTQVTLSRFYWRKDDRYTTRLFTRVPDLTSGVVTIADIYHDPRNDAPRLVNTAPGTLSLLIAPNPLSDESLISIGYDADQHPVALDIYSALGEKIVNLKSGLPGPPDEAEQRVEADIPIAPQDLPGPGLYFVRLVSSTQSLSRLLFVE